MKSITHSCFLALASVFFFSCKPSDESSVESQETASDSFQSFGKALASMPISASVSILDTKSRQLYKNNIAKLSYPAGTRVSISLQPEAPVEIKFQQTNSKQKYHGIDLELFAKSLKYRIYELKYDAQKGQFGIQTDPAGFNISSFFMAGALNWLVAPQIPTPLKQKAIKLNISNIRGLISDSKNLLEKFIGTPAEGKNFSLSSLSNLTMDATITFPRMFRIRSGNAQIEFARESFVNILVFTSGNILKPKADSIHFTFSDLKVFEDKKNKNLLSFGHAGWIKDAIVKHGGETTVHLKTLISEETLNLGVKNHKFVLQNKPNPTYVQKIVESSAQELLPILMPIVQQIDAAVPEIEIMSSAGL